MIQRLSSSEAKKHLKNLKYWSIVKNHLEKEYEFEDFSQALDFVNRVAIVAEKLDHHPDIYLSYGKVKIILYTHSIKGLSEKDFNLATFVDKIK